MLQKLPHGLPSIKTKALELREEVLHWQPLWPIEVRPEKSEKECPGFPGSYGKIAYQKNLRDFALAFLHISFIDQKYLWTCAIREPSATTRMPKVAF